MINTLQKLKEMAIAIHNGIIAMRPKENKKVIFNPSVDKKMEHCYCSNSGIVSFVADGTMYVIPYMASVMAVLNSEGFERKAMYVPFSNDEYPIGEKKKWDSLIKLSELERAERFTSECKKYSDKHGYGKIADDLINNHCLEIPATGVHVIKFQNSDVYYPEITGSTFSNSAANTIGKYCIEKGICSFVYRNGKTYVTKNSDVISALQAAGYMLGNLHVPFANGEIITDTKEADIWKRIA
ncbi:MAG: hypothetical protein J6M60_02570 [Clostridia bacterium]|nr:hypothetical protein [Clostridia bacterium]